jgi:hypothetical protein
MKVLMDGLREIVSKLNEIITECEGEETDDGDEDEETEEKTSEMPKKALIVASLKRKM